MEEGQKVKAGDTLVHITSQFADAQLDEARAMHYNLAVEGGGEILILEDGIHFFHAALGYVDHRGRGIAVHAPPTARSTPARARR